MQNFEYLYCMLILVGFVISTGLIIQLWHDFRKTQFSILHILCIFWNKNYVCLYLFPIVIILWTPLEAKKIERRLLFLFLSVQFGRFF
jgi:hypothetical protein